jgi:hypothetical protein
MTTVSYDRTGKLVSILCEKEKLLYPIEENTLESRSLTGEKSYMQRQRGVPVIVNK